MLQMNREASGQSCPKKVCAEKEFSLEWKLDWNLEKVKRKKSWAGDAGLAV